MLPGWLLRRIRTLPNFELGHPKPLNSQSLVSDFTLVASISATKAITVTLTHAEQAFVQDADK